MSEQKPVLSQSTMTLFEELEQECLTTIRYIEALKVKDLSDDQKEDIIGELSASITHLKIQSEQLDRWLEED
jgi:hypothetical protein